MVAGATAVSGGSITLNNAGILTLATPALAGLTYQTWGTAYTFSDPSGSSELAALYDQYRLVRVDVELVPIYNTSLSTPTAGNGSLAGWLHSVQDYDDAAAPTASNTGILTLQQYRSYRCDPLVAHGRLTWSIRPKVAMAAFGATLFTQYAVTEAPWIDCNSAVVEHYGLKFIFEIVNPGANIAFLDYRFNVRYHLEMREVR